MDESHTLKQHSAHFESPTDAKVNNKSLCWQGACTRDPAWKVLCKEDMGFFRGVCSRGTQPMKVREVFLEEAMTKLKWEGWAGVT